MFEIDDISHLLSVETEYSLSEIDQKLSERDYTLGYFVPPQNEINHDMLSRNGKENPHQIHKELGDIMERTNPEV